MDSMPGSFFLDSPAPPKLDLVGARSQLFQTPQTPSASSSLYHSISCSRKRPRHEIEKSPRSDLQSDLAGPSAADHRHADDAQTWHGKQKTPVDPDYRPNHLHRNSSSQAINDNAELLAPSERSGNSRKRTRRESLLASSYGSQTSIQPQPATGGSWGRTVINMVGKVWDFCWSGAFGGFYAGGGRGYRMDPGGTPLDDAPFQQTSIEKDDVFTSSGRGDTARIPGQFPEDDIQRNWVVVPEEDRDIFVDAVSLPSPTRRANRKNVNPFHTQRRRAMMAHHGKRTRLQTTPTKPRPGSPASPQSPSSVETQRHVAQMRKRGRQEDASLRRLNEQMEMMIKEGKAALGTRVEVGDADIDIDMED